MRATLKAKNEEQKEFTFGQDTLKVKSSDAVMSLDSTNSQLQIDLNIWTQDDLAIAASRSIKLASRIPSLRDYLFKLGLKPADFGKITHGDVLHYMVGNTERTIDLLLSGAPAVIVKSGLNLLKPDLDLSQSLLTLLLQEDL